MTQAVGNTLNNLEQLLLSQKEAQNLAEKPFSGMDKYVDFKKIFDDKLEKNQNTIEDLKKMSLCDKNINVSINVNLCNIQDEDALIEQETLISAEDFKEILDKEIDEVNVETSLDLTLAKDIEEIISQLKEAIEDTVKIIDESKTSEKSLDDETKTPLEGLIAICDNNVSTTLPTVDDLDSSLESIVNLANKITTLNNSEGKLLEFNEQNSDEALNLDKFELTQDEIMEFVDANIDETITSRQTKENSSITQNLELDEEIIKELKIESLSAQSESSNNSTFMQQQTPEEHAVKVAINSSIEGFELKLESAQNGQNIQNIQQVVQKSVDVNPSRILDQITKHLEGLQNGNKVNIVLNPDSLGKVNIQLMTTKDGLTAQFTVTTQEARDMLTKGLDGLKEALGTHGVAVDNVSVKFTETQKSEYNQDWTEQEGSRGGNKKQEQQNREEKQKGLFEKMLAQTTNDENGNV
ncbi:flagellar hook-length control protein FliK [bacterium]|nr:flagellar hook-length control protein FliK [bacterium]